MPSRQVSDQTSAISESLPPLIAWRRNPWRRSAPFVFICFFARTLMRTTQQFSITLPYDMAEVVEGKIKSGAYASVSEVVREGVRALLERDAAIERWLREEVVAGHAEYLADPSKGVPAEEILGRIKARRASEAPLDDCRWVIEAVELAALHHRVVGGGGTHFQAHTVRSPSCRECPK